MFKFTFIEIDAKSKLLLTIYFFSSLFCRCSPKKCCHSLCNCEYTRSNYDNNDFLIKNGLALNNILIRFKILFSMYFICVFQISFNNTPRNVIDSVQTISLLIIFNFGKTSGISSFLLALWKNEYLFFFASESLLEMNYSLIFCNSSFTLRKAVFIFLFEWNEFVVSKTQ